MTSEEQVERRKRVLVGGVEAAYPRFKTGSLASRNIEKMEQDKWKQRTLTKPERRKGGSVLATNC